MLKKNEKELEDIICASEYKPSWQDSLNKMFC